MTLGEFTLRTAQLDGLRPQYSVNLSGAFFLAQAALEHMLERGTGRVINRSAAAALPDLLPFWLIHVGWRSSKYAEVTIAVAYLTYLEIAVIGAICAWCATFAVTGEGKVAELEAITGVKPMLVSGVSGDQSAEDGASTVAARRADPLRAFPGRSSRRAGNRDGPRSGRRCHGDG